MVPAQPPCSRARWGRSPALSSPAVHTSSLPAFSSPTNGTVRPGFPCQMYNSSLSTSNRSNARPVPYAARRPGRAEFSPPLPPATEQAAAKPNAHILVAIYLSCRLHRLPHRLHLQHPMRFRLLIQRQHVRAQQGRRGALLQRPGMPERQTCGRRLWQHGMQQRLPALQDRRVHRHLHEHSGRHRPGQRVRRQQQRVRGLWAERRSPVRPAVPHSR